MIALIPLFPLLGFLLNGLWYAVFQAPEGRKATGSTISGAIGSIAIFASLLVSLWVFVRLMGLPEGGRVLEENLFTWIAFGDLKIDMVLRVDVLSTLFTLVITGVGTLIHVYSIGYMSHDASPGKFFAYLNLFCFAMLMLVVGGSLPILFLGWEGVGLCSFLLIGYWYDDEAKAVAGKKAFIVNRLGDLGFLLGMFLIFTTFGTLDFVALQGSVGSTSGVIGASTITAICLLLFVGCMGKSAQIPLYVWLPDAMAGPTPVSALIHAATMVTSGIYLISRLNFLFSLSPVALSVVAIVGAVTAFFAATIALVQTDIKKILAYSTVSQLGYMFLACGVGAYSAGVFHVITHAFFKALLFLGAGSVIHGMHEEQNILHMGGLRSRMPKTFLIFAIGWLAICGVPPLSGFFSKDEVLWVAYSSPHGSMALWALGAVTALMTAFYMTRLFSLTFLGEPRFKAAHRDSEIHESPMVMVLPLQVLAVLSVVGGFVGLPHLSWLSHWLDPVIPAHHSVAEGVAPAMEWVLMGLSTVGAVGTIYLGLKFFSNLKRAEAFKTRWAWIHRVLENKWYVDEVYDAIIVRPLQAVANVIWKGMDVAFIDRIVLGVGHATAFAGQAVRVIQTGSIQVYAFVLLAGLVAMVGYLIYGLA